MEEVKEFCASSLPVGFLGDLSDDVEVTRSVW